MYPDWWTKFPPVALKTCLDFTIATVLTDQLSRWAGSKLYLIVPSELHVNSSKIFLFKVSVFFIEYTGMEKHEN